MVTRFPKEGKMLVRKSLCSTLSLAIVALLVGTLAAIGRASDQPHLYVFSMPGCRPCQQMEPEVDRLIREGYPITKVDCVANESFANRFQITQTPTTVVVAQNQVVARTLGPQNAVTLVKMLEAAGFQMPAAGAPSAPTLQRISSPQPTANTTTNLDQVTRGENHWTQPQLTAHQATIRLKVEDPQGTSYATGTVIHSHGNECLAMTCGHVFRESKGSGKITVDYAFENGQHLSSPGQLIKYDSEAKDVGLVAFRVQRPIQPVRIGPAALPVQPGDQSFTLGCNHGEDPTLRTTQIIRSAVYDGAKKYDIVGRPVDGRSGGGLFSAGGQLIGVCNAAAVESDEGVYTSLDNIYWQIDQANLAHLFQPAAAAEASAVAQTAPQQSPQFTGQLDVRSPQIAREIAGDIEIIMVVRSKSEPAKSETFSIAQPSSQLLGLVESLRTSDLSTRPTASNRYR
jgi:hypothetical protein